MKSILLLSSKTPLTALMCVVLASTTGAPVLAQERQNAPSGLPQDWSHKYVIHVNPDTYEDALSKGAIDEWTKKANDPRFVLQLENKLRKAEVANQNDFSDQSHVATKAALAVEAKRRRPPPPPHLSGFAADWSVTGLAGSVAAGVFPAKYSFSPIGNPVCGSGSVPGDFVVFALNGAANAANIAAFNNLYSASGNTGFCSTGPTASALWAYLTPNTIATSPVPSLSGSAIAWVDGAAGALTLRVLRWRQNDGVTGAFPNKTISGAAAPVNCSTPAVAPCMFSVALSTGGTAGAASGSLFVDYSNDTGYVTDSLGNFYKVKKVFDGTVSPSLAWGAGGAGNTTTRIRTTAQVSLTSPVYDFNGSILAVDVNGNIQKVTDVADGSTPSTPAVVRVGGNASVIDGLLLTLGSTQANDRVFAFASLGLAAGFSPDTVNHSANAIVAQAPTSLLGTSVKIANVGINGGSVNSGAFDNTYYSGSGGFLYVCGNAAAATTPSLYRIGFTAQPAMNTSIANGPFSLAGNNNGPNFCSPLTEIFNTATSIDWLFLSVTGDGTATACINGGGGNNFGCVQSFNITSAFPTIASASALADGGTGGIVIDNVANTATFPQASSIYFGRRTVSTVTKLTQSALQ